MVDSVVLTLAQQLLKEAELLDPKIFSKATNERDKFEKILDNAIKKMKNSPEKKEANIILDKISDLMDDLIELIGTVE